MLTLVSARPSARLRQVLLGFVACFALGSAGCLDFEKETVLLVFPKDRDEFHALLIYEGLHVSGDKGDELAKAKDQLKTLMTGETEFYLGDNWITRVSIEEAKDESEDSRKWKSHLRKHMTIRNGAFFANQQGKLCGYQTITIKPASKFVEGVNKLLCEDLAKMTADKIAENKNDDAFWDLFTLQIVHQAARDNYAWVKYEPGRISISTPASPEVIRRTKKHIMQVQGLQQLREKVMTESKLDLNGLRKEIEQQEQIANQTSQIPWSFDHRKDRMTLSLGVGEGEPLLLELGAGSTKLPRGEGDLTEYARSLPLPFHKNETTESLMDEFKRGKLEKKGR